MTVGALAAVVAAAGACLPASAQWRRPEDEIKYHQANMAVMARHFGRLHAMGQGETPYDTRAASDNAAVVFVLAKLPWSALHEWTDNAPSRAGVVEVREERGLHVLPRGCEGHAREGPRDAGAAASVDQAQVLRSMAGFDDDLAFHGQCGPQAALEHLSGMEVEGWIVKHGPAVVRGWRVEGRESAG